MRFNQSLGITIADIYGGSRPTAQQSSTPPPRPVTIADIYGGGSRPTAQQVEDMSNPPRLSSGPPPELVTGRPYVEGDELTQASSSEDTESGELMKPKLAIVLGVAVVLVGGTLVYLFTKKKRR